MDKINIVNGHWFDASCESCGKSFYVNALMNAHSILIHYCRECVDKTINKVIKEVKKEMLKMNIKDAMVALYEGKKVRPFLVDDDNVEYGYTYILRNGKIDYLDESLKENVNLMICEEELEAQWEIVEDE